MKEPALKLADNGCKWGASLVLLAFAMTGMAATFPLTIPTRPMSFPLNAPADQGLDIFGWGQNSLGQTAIPANATNVVAIAGGANHSLALGRLAVSILTQPRGQRVLEGNSVTLNINAMDHLYTFTISGAKTGSVFLGPTVQIWCFRRWRWAILGFTLW